MSANNDWVVHGYDVIRQNGVFTRGEKLSWRFQYVGKAFAGHTKKLYHLMLMIDWKSRRLIFNEAFWFDHKGKHVSILGTIEDETDKAGMFVGRPMRGNPNKTWPPK